MHIQSIRSCGEKPTFKALYFTKTPTIMLNKTAEFMPHEKISTTSKGIRYLKDTEISKSLKERFANNSFIKKMAKKYDTFVWFVESKTNDGFKTWAKITRVQHGETELPPHYVIGKSEYTQKTATENMFTALKNKNFTVL